MHMDGSSNAASVKADPNFLLRTVKALDKEGSYKVNSNIGEGWLILYPELWKWWSRRCFARSSAYNTLIQQLPNGLSALKYSKPWSQVSEAWPELTKSNRTYHFFLANSLRKWGEVRQWWTEFVKNGTVSKFWLTEITGPPPEVIPKILVRRNRPKFQKSLHWPNGKHPRYSCLDAL